MTRTSKTITHIDIRIDNQQARPHSLPQRDHAIDSDDTDLTTNRKLLRLSLVGGLIPVDEVDRGVRDEVQPLACRYSNNVGCGTLYVCEHARAHACQHHAHVLSDPAPDIMQTCAPHTHACDSRSEPSTTMPRSRKWLTTLVANASAKMSNPASV